MAHKTPRPLWLAAAAALLSLGGAVGAAEPTYFTLPNGLKACVVQEAPSDVAVVQLALHITADCEPADKAGLRALLQHTLRFGWELRLTKDPALAFLADMDDARGGMATNCDWEYVGFGYAGTAETLPTALAFLAAGVFRPEFTPEAFDGAGKLVRSVLSGSQAEPAESTHALFRLALTGTPTRAYLLGTPDSVAGARLSDLVAFHRRFYVPNLAAVCVISPSPTAEVKALIEREFGGLAAGKSDLPPPPSPPRELGARVESNPALAVAGMPDLSVASMVIGAPAPAYDDPDLPVAYLLQAMLGPNPDHSGRLDKDSELWHLLSLPFSPREARQRGLIEGLPPQLSRRNYLAVHAYLSPLNLEQVRQEVVKTFARLAEAPPKTEELERAKTYVTNTRLCLLDEPRQRALLLGRAVALGQPGPLVTDFLARVAAVTPQDCRRVAQTYFTRHAEGLELPDTGKRK